MIFWLCVAASIAPLCAARYLPFTDLPEHVAAMATMSRYFDHGGVDAATYQITFWKSQYLVYHASGALLTRITGDAVLANRLLLVGLAFALPISLRSVLRAFGRDDVLAVLACMPFLSRPLFVGFLPYVASLPLYLFGVALVVRRAGRLRGSARARRDGVLLAGLAVALVYTHLSALVVFVATVVPLELVLAARGAVDAKRVAGAAKERTKIHAGAFVLARIRSLAWLAPAGAIAAAWSVAARITLGGGSLREPQEIGTMRISRSLHALPMWAFDVFLSHVDELCGAVWWISLAALAVLGTRAAASEEQRARPARARAKTSKAPFVIRQLARLDPAYVPLAVVLAVFVVTPFRVGAGGMLNVRLAPLVALTAVLTIGRSVGRWRNVILGAVALASVVHAGNAAWEVHTIAAENVAELDTLLDAMRPGSRVVSLVFDERHTRMHFDPYPFAASYHRARGGGVASYSFSDLVHWPVQYRDSARPPQKAYPLWIYAPCEYRNTTDGAYYDYVLVSGDVDPFAWHPAGPVFREVRRVASGFVLYEKVPGETWEGPETDGPCAPPP